MMHTVTDVFQAPNKDFWPLLHHKLSRSMPLRQDETSTCGRAVQEPASSRADDR